ncbi:MAG: hypothetical protein ACREOG_20965 [Gemmatimonadaceae bacterium]
MHAFQASGTPNVMQATVPPTAPNTDIPVAVINGAFVVVGALIAVFADQLRRFVLGRRTKNALAGQWSATWTVTNPLNHPKSGLTDMLEFTSFSGDEFKGTGQNTDFGKYDVEGKDAKFAVSLLFRGQEAAATLIGTAILKRIPSSRRSKDHGRSTRPRLSS